MVQHASGCLKGAGADFVRVKCYTLHTLMLILKEAINALSAPTSASAPPLLGASDEVVRV